jgi:queuine tRNA-ribosyltransferase
MADDSLRYELLARDGAARRGRVHTLHGSFETPAFMPVGTYGTVKALTPEQLRALGAEIVLANTFHLMLRPGDEIVRDLGGLHGFMQWSGPILTDSGGFQVYSLGDLRRIDEDGVTFKSPINGDKVFLSPEISMAVQRNLGADIVMQFDECTPYPATPDQARDSMALSLRWAARSQAAHSGNPAALFGIVQGGMYPELRLESLAGLLEIGFDGYAIGGLSVGEPKDEMQLVLEGLLPPCQPSAPAI